VHHQSRQEAVGVSNGSPQGLPVLNVNGTFRPSNKSISTSNNNNNNNTNHYSKSNNVNNSHHNVTTTTTTTTTTSTSNNGSNYYLPRNFIKTMPFHNQGFVISNSTNNTTTTTNNNNKRYYNLNNNNNNNNNSSSYNNVSSTNQQQSLGANGYNITTKTSNNELYSKPRLITIVRATDRPRKKISILLNRKALHSFEQFVHDISEAFGLPKWKNDKVRKLYTIKGRRVAGISDFFRDDEVFVGASNKKPITTSLIKDLLDEYYFDNPEYAATLLNEWEAAKLKTKSRYSSLDNVGAHSTNNNSNDLNGDNKSDGTVNSKKEQRIEFDENGRRRRKKKRIDTLESIPDLETQRQRERLKLIEEEKKKRAAISNNNNNNNNLNTNDRSTKRVSINLPPISNDSILNNNNDSEKRDMLTPLQVKKLKKKSKIKKNNNSSDVESLDVVHEKNTTTPTNVALSLNDDTAKNQNHKNIKSPINNTTTNKVKSENNKNNQKDQQRSSQSTPQSLNPNNKKLNNNNEVKKQVIIPPSNNKLKRQVKTNKPTLKKNNIEKIFNFTFNFNFRSPTHLTFHLNTNL
jgi:hypothetical protein